MNPNRRPFRAYFSWSTYGLLGALLAVIVVGINNAIYDRDRLIGIATGIILYPLALAALAYCMRPWANRYLTYRPTRSYAHRTVGTNPETRTIETPDIGDGLRHAIRLGLTARIMRTNYIDPPTKSSGRRALIGVLLSIGMIAYWAWGAQGTARSIEDSPNMAHGIGYVILTWVIIWTIVGAAFLAARGILFALAARDCRKNGHRWRRDVEFTSHDHGYLLVPECERCATVAVIRRGVIGDLLYTDTDFDTLRRRITQRGGHRIVTRDNRKILVGLPMEHIA